jgi:hypothetical protein
MKSTIESPSVDSILKFNNHYANSLDHEDYTNHKHTTNANNSSSTPLGTKDKTVFKLTPHKQTNHSRLKLQTSPYYYHHHQHHLTKLTNSDSCSNSSVSNSSHSFVYTLNTSLNTSSTDESQNLSTKTNPPSTPVQLSYSGDSDSIQTSPIICNHVIANVTPASTTSPYTGTSTTSTSTGTTSNSVQAYSRSSSYTSLSSCDLKSTYSSIPSEYTTGFHTPFSTATYSELPDSPGDQMDYYTINRVANNYMQANYCHSSQKPDELSMLSTVDSNPSKSNDITIVERTILAANSNNMTTHQSSTHSSGGAGGYVLLNNNNNHNHKYQSNSSKPQKNNSSAYNSESNSFLSHTPKM